MNPRHVVCFERLPKDKFPCLPVLEVPTDGVSMTGLPYPSSDCRVSRDARADESLAVKADELLLLKGAMEMKPRRKPRSERWACQVRISESDASF